MCLGVPSSTLSYSASQLLFMARLGIERLDHVVSYPGLPMAFNAVN